MVRLRRRLGEVVARDFLGAAGASGWKTS